MARGGGANIELEAQNARMDKNTAQRMKLGEDGKPVRQVNQDQNELDNLEEIGTAQQPAQPPVTVGATLDDCGEVQKTAAKKKKKKKKKKAEEAVTPRGQDDMNEELAELAKLKAEEARIRQEEEELEKQRHEQELRETEEQIRALSE